MPMVEVDSPGFGSLDLGIRILARQITTSREGRRDYSYVPWGWNRSRSLDTSPVPPSVRFPRQKCLHGENLCRLDSPDATLLLVVDLLNM
jgi:hypothetical protein